MSILWKWKYGRMVPLAKYGGWVSFMPLGFTVGNWFFGAIKFKRR